MAHSIFWSHALVRAAIIDLDDTLGDVVAINATRRAGLQPVDEAFLERTLGKGSEHLIRMTLARHQARLPGEQADRIRAAVAGVKTTRWLLRCRSRGDVFERNTPDRLPLLKACEGAWLAPAHTRAA
jgi:hypothetical protein